MKEDTIQVVIVKEGPMVSVIIPSLGGYRFGNVPRLIGAIKQQTCKDLELILVKGVKPCAQAHNEGVRYAQGEILVFFDDDITLGHEEVIENLVRPLMEDNGIGITGASQLIPNDSNWFQKRCAQEFARVQFPIVSELVESDMATHAAMAIQKEVFMEVGQENENLMFGDDPDLRYRVRKAGYKIVIVPDTWVFHPQHRNLKVSLRTAFHRGRGAAHDFKYYPELMYETPPASRLTGFIPRRNFLYRIGRFCFQLIWSILTLKPIFLLTRIIYALGFVGNLIWPRKDA